METNMNRLTAPLLDNTVMIVIATMIVLGVVLTLMQSSATQDVLTAGWRRGG